MIKLTRLNNHLVAINPDHIGWADATPDTTLCLIGGEKIIIRESIDELIALIVEFRRTVRSSEAVTHPLGAIEGDPPRISHIPTLRRNSNPPPSYRPPSYRPRGT